MPAVHSGKTLVAATREAVSSSRSRQVRDRVVVRAICVDDQVAVRAGPAEGRHHKRVAIRVAVVAENVARGGATDAGGRCRGIVYCGWSAIERKVEISGSDSAVAVRNAIGEDVVQWLPVGPDRFVTE